MQKIKFQMDTYLMSLIGLLQRAMYKKKKKYFGANKYLFIFMLYIFSPNLLILNQIFYVVDIMAIVIQMMKTID